MVLDPVEGEPDSDYINASYVDVSRILLLLVDFLILVSSTFQKEKDPTNILIFKLDSS